eukprot:TRINITY_DN4411_c0_g1_i2.p1 TRINITY_DN4411_c0_g1~~TRINITY_DN4411_c0_g1_i2.p1  ORF type:complete len:126 (-),score=50.07 TRINITY_DN4411_c0_g1_i2:109-486(-)
MRHLAAYLLLALGGTAAPTADDIKRVLASVGAKPDDAKIDLLIAELHGKDVNTLIAEGKAKMSSLVVAAPAAAPAASAPAAEGKEETKKGGKKEEPKKEKEEEKKEETKKEEEETVDMADFGLFD